MKSVLVLLAIAAVALAKFQYPEEWELWKKVTITLPDVYKCIINVHEDHNIVLNVCEYCRWLVSSNLS